jgi:hypothetical protein
MHDFSARIKPFWIYLFGFTGFTQQSRKFDETGLGAGSGGGLKSGHPPAVLDNEKQ